MGPVESAPRGGAVEELQVVEQLEPLQLVQVLDHVGVGIRRWGRLGTDVACVPSLRAAVGRAPPRAPRFVRLGIVAGAARLGRRRGGTDPSPRQQRGGQGQRYSGRSSTPKTTFTIGPPWLKKSPGQSTSVSPVKVSHGVGVTVRLTSSSGPYTNPP